MSDKNWIRLVDRLGRVYYRGPLALRGALDSSKYHNEVPPFAKAVHHALTTRWYWEWLMYGKGVVHGFGE